MEEPAVFKGASCLRVCGRCTLPKLVLVVVGLAIEPRHQARPCDGVWPAKGSRPLEVLLLGGRLGFGPLLLSVNRHLTKPLVRTDDSRFLSRDLLFIVCWWPPHTGGRWAAFFPSKIPLFNLTQYHSDKNI